ncbi:VirB4 family type IV secretion/conjugal transfer ATPase [Microvirga alba]|uniref:Type IV secretion system protein virB4 n=1 Tax=Microvirga alba TaxID=2791025 RepID=A0A931BVR0_9HYPH|nr:VirB4 family type IV secretion/conjugal transfer ATPase [Microvirga alba]MBF9235608.1 VirB4 family type IV secretion/conjugal transfer ATPase [Microvirga alba]
MNSAARRKTEVEADRFVPYVRHVNDTVISLRAGDLMTVMKLEGVSFETADFSDIERLHFQLNSLWQNVSDERLAVWTHIVRRRESIYPEGDFKSEFSERLNAKYKARLLGEELFRNDIYLTLVWQTRQGAAKAANSLSKLFGFQKAGGEMYEDGIKKLEKVVSTVKEGLATYRPEILSLVARDGLVFSEPMEFLHRIICGEHRDMPLVQGLLASALYTNRLIFGPETIQIRSPGRTKLAGMLAIKEYPATTRPGMLNRLLKVPFEFTLTQSFGFMSQSTAQSLMTRKQNQMVSSGDKGISQLLQLDEAQDDLISNRMVMGEHHLVLLVFGSDGKSLLDNLGHASARLSSGGAIVAREDLAIEAAYWSQLPGNFGHRARSGAITSRNFASLAPLHGFPQGRAEGNHWGPAVTLLKTTAGSPYFFNFHAGDLGNTLMIGPSGSGKTLTLNFLLAQLEKFVPRGVVFDKDRGAELFVRASGGSYLPLQNGKPTGCAPFKALDLTPANIVFLSQFVRKLVQVEGKPLKIQELAALDRAILALRELPIHQRSLMTLAAHLDNTEAEGLYARLERWMRPGPLGWVFDGESDEIKLDARLIGYDMTQFLDNPEIRTPLMMYLFHRVESLINGQRICIVIDEFWKALNDEAFVDLVQNKLKTIRKQNGFLVFATQSPQDALSSPIAHTIIEQCPTKIYFPNPNGKEDDYVKGYNCSRREYQLIQKEMSSDLRQFLIKQNRNSIVVELNLRGMDDEIALLSTREETYRLVEEIIAEHGSDPAVWCPIFHEKRRSL